ncbi:S49 family peptidase [Pseudonocardia acaciae]|uniref:S49 family peptidase n=1 Tax=Pseudonocardia acaciae TaxID=551276 RepID=UPI00049081D6|nr:S49 family peptidase [Pseudonocardia acaciae]
MTTLLDRLPNTVTGRLPGRLGERADRSVVSVVRLHGVITPALGPMARSVLNLSVLEPVLKRAFAPERLAAVALMINSPGGSATQSALIADRIRGLAEERGERKAPVLAFCEDVAASGGYWLACAADEIYAHATSLVGSIGVVSHGFGLAGLLERLGVERRLYTAGSNKARLDPFLPEKEEDVAWLSALQGQLHEQFQGWVKERRGDKLATGDGDLFNGEVWTGANAERLGLVDGLGTAREIIANRFPDAEPVLVEGRKPLLARLGVGAPAAGFGAASLAEGLLQAAELRAAWARFGL